MCRGERRVPHRCQRLRLLRAPERAFGVRLAGRRHQQAVPGQDFSKQVLIPGSFGGISTFLFLKYPSNYSLGKKMVVWSPKEGQVEGPGVAWLLSAVNTARWGTGQVSLPGPHLPLTALWLVAAEQNLVPEPDGVGQASPTSGQSCPSRHLPTIDCDQAQFPPSSSGTP